MWEGPHIGCIQAGFWRMKRSSSVFKDDWTCQDQVTGEATQFVPVCFLCGPSFNSSLPSDFVGEKLLHWDKWFKMKSFFYFSSEESVAKQLQYRQKALLQPASDELSVRSIWGKYNSQVFQVNLFFVFLNFFRASFVLKRNPCWPWSWLSLSCGRWGVRQQLQPQPQWQNQKMRQRMNMGRGGQWTELSGIMEKMTCRLVRWDVAGCAASCWIGEPIL